MPSQQAFNIHLKPTGSQSHWISYTPLHEVGTLEVPYHEILAPFQCRLLPDGNRERERERERGKREGERERERELIYQLVLYSYMHVYDRHTATVQGLGYEARTYRSFVSL